MKSFKIEDRLVGGNAPCYVIAEVSCNHEGDFNEARRIIEAAADAGVDAAKLQTYRADTMTRDFDTRPSGTMWEDIDLFQLYQKAHTPWDWHAELSKVAADVGIHLFSTPFDESAVDFLMEMDVPVMKIASFEAVDTKLIEKVAKTGLPVIISNGMTDFFEMQESIQTLRQFGCEEICLTHCNSGYPASLDDVNLATMSAIEEMFDVVVGLSDHTIFADDKNKLHPVSHVSPVEAVKFGAKVIEVHLMMDREKGRQLNEKQLGGFDWPFSREPAELKQTIEMIREYESTGSIIYETEFESQQALRTHGTVTFEPTEKECKSRILRPSLWVVDNVKKGEPLMFAGSDRQNGNFDSIRPAGGIHIRFTDFIAGKVASRDLKAGETLTWDMVQFNQHSVPTHLRQKKYA